MPYAEQRQHPRYLLVNPIKGIAVTPAHKGLDCRLIDLSMGGARVVVALPERISTEPVIDTGERLSATFMIPAVPEEDPQHLTFSLTCRRVVEVPVNSLEVAGTYVRNFTVSQPILEYLINSSQAISLSLTRGVLRMRGALTLGCLDHIDPAISAGVKRIEVDPDCDSAVIEVMKDLFRCSIFQIGDRLRAGA